MFFIILVYTLSRKLRSSKFRNGEENSSGARRGMRATFILSPLLGIPYFLYPITPEDDSPFTFYYHITSAVFSSFQVSL